MMIQTRRTQTKEEAQKRLRKMSYGRIAKMGGRDSEHFLHDLGFQDTGRLWDDQLRMVLTRLKKEGAA